MADLPVDPWTGQTPGVAAGSIPVAELEDGLLRRLQALEEELRTATDRNIVLVAYDNGPLLRH
jgi:hypothetical protein